MTKIILKPIRPSYAIGLSYKQKLLKLTKAMISDINKFVEKHYAKNYDEIETIAQDADPVLIMQRLLKQRLRKWSKIFKDKSVLYSNNMVQDVDKHNGNVLNSALSDVYKQPIIKLSIESKQIMYAKRAVLLENVNLITNINDEYASRINTAVLQSISRGRDNTYLKEQLIKIAGITERRAKNISRDQLNKASSVINNARMLDIGIKKAEWHHSHAGKKPRVSHQHADGKEYDIRKGCKIDGEYIYPGQLINCRCFSSPILEF